MPTGRPQGVTPEHLIHVASPPGMLRCLSIFLCEAPHTMVAVSMAWTTVKHMHPTTYTIYIIITIKPPHLITNISVDSDAKGCHIVIPSKHPSTGSQSNYVSDNQTQTFCLAETMMVLFYVQRKGTIEREDILYTNVLKIWGAIICREKWLKKK